MCSSKSKLSYNISIAKINGRPVLQPKSNQVPSLERRNSLKKSSPKSPSPTPTTKQSSSLSPPISPKLKSPRPPALKRTNEPNPIVDKVLLTRNSVRVASTTVKKSKSCIVPVFENCNMNYSSSLIVESPGSIAAARREQVAVIQEKRKLRIAHYGRVKSNNNAKIAPPDSQLDSNHNNNDVVREERRCSFITPTSDPIYVEYHDHQWGVPVHDDKMLFELLALTGAQVGSDWTSVLKKREAFREAFADFEAEIVAKYSEKKITSISGVYGIELSQIRGIVDNSNRILQVKKEFGSFEKYLWAFVNHKPITSCYRLSNKIPAKTSKSETISRDMVKRGFRYVGPTVIHSFMQAAGLSNDHLITCPRHQLCLQLASQ